MMKLFTLLLGATMAVASLGGSVTDVPEFTTLLHQLILEARSVAVSEGSDTISRGGTLNAKDQLFASNKAAHLQVQGDGNMVVYQANNKVLWASNTAGGSGTHLVLQGDGNLVLYDGSKVLWATNTNKGGRLVMQGDCNLVLYNTDNSVGWASNTKCSPSPPGPSPGPSPPGPSPGPNPADVPNVPSKPLWFGMWGSNPAIYPWSSIAWDNIPDGDIDQYGGPSLRFFYDVTKFFCPDKSNCHLYSDYQTRWNNAVPKMTQLLTDQKILGFFLGDEVICSNKGTGPSNTMANTVRNTFPRGKAIIFLNDCGSTFSKYDIPENVDWVSADNYRKSKDQDYVGKVKGIYNDGIFKKLRSYQRAVVIPGVGHPRDHYKICDDGCTANVELQDAKDFLSWAQGDHRIVAMAPYSWSRDGKIEQGLDQLGSNENLKNFYMNLGKSTK